MSHNLTDQAVGCPKKPLIALLTNNDDDIYCFRKELIEAFIADGYDMLISCPYGEKFQLMTDIPFIYDDPVIDRRGTNVIADYKLLRHYTALFKRYSPDIVLTYTAKPNVYGSMAARRLKIPYINNVTGFGSALNKPGLLRTLIFHLFKHAFSRAACVMFQNSTNMKQAEEAGMVPSLYYLLPGSGVNTSRFALQPYPAGGNGIDGAPVVFNYIGRILHDKGVDDYIAAAKFIKARYPNTEFNMIGFIEPTESHYVETLKQLQEHGMIFYRGSQKDVRPYIARSHATIHPSMYGEGMSNVLLESASSGRPLITTDNPGCKETVLDKESGFIYPGGQVDKLCATIEHFLAMDNASRQRMGERGRRHVEENFSRSKVISIYSQAIKSIIQV